MADAALDLFIVSGDAVSRPIAVDDVTWTTERRGAAGKLTCKILKDNGVSFFEGNSVYFKADGFPVFYGFVFKKSRDKDGVIEVIAYDQLRYLKNKGMLPSDKYGDETASQLLLRIAAEARLRVGAVEQAEYVIPPRIAKDKDLFDVILTALDEEISNKGNFMFLYDDFGALSLRSVGSLQSDVLIDARSAQDFEYVSSIDDKTYNKIKLSYENKETETTEIYIEQDGQRMNDWGVLQFYGNLNEDENGAAKARLLLALYDRPTRSLKVEKIRNLGADVRAGYLVPVSLNLGDVSVNNKMMAETCEHTWRDGEHWVDLKLIGGGFSE